MRKQAAPPLPLVFDCQLSQHDAMTARPLLIYPDPRLAVSCAPVTTFGAELSQLVEDLRDTLAAARAVGLTPAHYGVPTRITAIRLEPSTPPLLFVNPLIIERSLDVATHEEGSVCMPGLTETVTRPARISITYQDLDGATREMAADGFLAACIQHEIDQLDGIFWIERLSRLKRERLVKKHEKSRRQGRL